MHFNFTLQRSEAATLASFLLKFSRDGCTDFDST